MEYLNIYLTNIIIFFFFSNKEAMDIIIKTGFQSITHQINFQPATVTKGKNLALAEHVRDVEEHRRNNNSFLIKSRIIRQASVHSTPYITSLTVI